MNFEEKTFFTNEFLPSLATRALDLETLFIDNSFKMLK